MTAPYYEDDAVTLWHGDCLDVMAALPDSSVDAVVTDPPYGLGFMGREWDDLPPGLPWARECLRVLKPGGHLLAFGGSRTWHRLAVAVEDAGFEMRDSIAWLYGSGFPKSLDVSKAIDKAAGATREVVGSKLGQPGYAAGNAGSFILHGCRSVDELETLAERDAVTPDGRSARATLARLRESEAHRFGLTAPATPAAQQWQGWGTALKPAFEPVVVGRKPLVGTVAANVLAHGTGALNIDGCRVEANGERFGGGAKGSSGFAEGYEAGAGFITSTSGRWPTNVVLDGHAADELDAQSGTLTSGKMQPTHTTAGVNGRGTYGKDAAGGFTTMETYGDSGGASRFFPTFRYQAKAPTRERPKVGDVAHPTVKPLELMRWLVRLVTPPGGLVLEPFAGSGTTMEAAILEGFQCIGIEREADYLPLIRARTDRNRHTADGLPAAAEALALFDFEEPA